MAAKKGSVYANMGFSERKKRWNTDVATPTQKGLRLDITFCGTKTATNKATTGQQYNELMQKARYGDCPELASPTCM